MGKAQRQQRTNGFSMVKVLLKMVLVLLVTGLLQGCGSLFYWPEAGLRGTPDQLGIDYQPVDLITDNGLSLHAWWFPSRVAEEAKPQGLIYYLHGNAENISTHFMGMTWITNHGWEVFILDYRGYGISEGKPSIAGVHHDAYMGLKWAIAKAKEQQIPLVVLGQSIGGATAVTLVANATAEEQQQISGLVVDSAFSGYRRIAREKLNASWITWAFQYPLSWTITDSYSPEKHLAKLPENLPLLIIHSCADDVIPCSHSQRIYNQAAEPKTYLEAQEGRHIAMLSQLKWRKELMAWLEAVKLKY